MTSLPDIPEIDADFSESKPDEHLEAIRQEHEPFLTKLEALAVEAIASNDWNDFYAHLIEFQSKNDLHGVTGIAIGQELNDHDQPI
jgi:uncharacterized protein YqfB (UPF0267 family)